MLIALGDAGRAARLAAALSQTGDVNAVIADGNLVEVVDVSIVDGTVGAAAYVVLGSAIHENMIRLSRPGQGYLHPPPRGGLYLQQLYLRLVEGLEVGVIRATLPGDADDTLIIAAARLAAAGYRIVHRSERRADSDFDDPFADDGGRAPIRRYSPPPGSARCWRFWPESTEQGDRPAARHFSAHGKVPRRGDPGKTRRRQPYRRHRHRHAPGAGAVV